MTKSQLIEILSMKFPTLPKEVLAKIVNIILEEMSKALIENRRVEIRGFGAFSLRKRAARMARNPRTDKVTMVGDRFAIYFRSGKDFFDTLNN
jgi:integration host factor subunit beta